MAVWDAWSETAPAASGKVWDAWEGADADGQTLVSERQQKPVALPRAQVVDASLALLSGAVAAPVAGLAGIAGAALPGPEGQGADWVRKTQEALTYEPRTALGETAVNIASWPGRKLAELGGSAGGKIADVTGSPLAGTIVDTAVQSLPLLIGPATKGIAPGGETYAAFAKRRAAQVEALQRDAALVKARTDGYVVPPQQAAPGAVNSALEGLGGKIKTAQRLSAENQPVTNRLVREDFNLPADVPLDRATFSAIRSTAGQAYDAVRNAGIISADLDYVSALSRIEQPHLNTIRGFPRSDPSPILREIDAAFETTFDAGAAVDKIRALRDKADTAYRGGDKSLGRDYKAIAQAIEDQLGRHLETASGVPPNVLSDFQEARRTIAKTYTVEKALRETTGNVDAKKLAARLTAGDYLDGNLRKIAEFAQAFPKAAQVPEVIGGVGISPLDVAFAVGKGGAWGMVPFTRPFVRNILASDIYQNAMVKPPTYGPSLGSRLLGVQQNALAPLLEMSEGPQR